MTNPDHQDVKAGDVKAFNTYTKSNATSTKDNARKYFDFLPDVSQFVIFPGKSKTAPRGEITQEVRKNARSMLENKALLPTLLANNIPCAHAAAVILAQELEDSILEKSNGCVRSAIYIYIYG